MTLHDLCEPLFHYVCGLNRMARTAGGTDHIDRRGRSQSSRMLDFEVVRGDIKNLLSEAAQKAATDSRLAEQFRRMELPLVFFVDSMIADSRLEFADRWHSNRLAAERREMAGDERFFDFLDETLQDDSEEAKERLMVFYVCLGLGFTGMYKDSPFEIGTRMKRMLQRIRRSNELSADGRITPETYEGVDTRDFVLPPTGKFVGLTVAFVVCTLAVGISYVWLFRSASRSLTQSLDRIVQVEAAPAAATPPVTAPPAATPPATTPPAAPPTAPVAVTNAPQAN